MLNPRKSWTQIGSTEVSIFILFCFFPLMLNPRKSLTQINMLCYFPRCNNLRRSFTHRCFHLTPQYKDWDVYLFSTLYLLFLYLSVQLTTQRLRCVYILRHFQKTSRVIFNSQYKDWDVYLFGNKTFDYLPTCYIFGRLCSFRCLDYE